MKKLKKIIIVLMIIVCLGIIGFFGTRIIENNGDFTKEINNNKQTELKLKSTVQDNREKVLIYKFNKKNVLEEIIVNEKYEDKELYDEQKENYKLHDEIELLNCDDDKLEIKYKKLDLGNDKDLNYDEILEKYTNSLKVYETVK